MAPAPGGPGGPPPPGDYNWHAEFEFTMVWTENSGLTQTSKGIEENIPATDFMGGPTRDELEGELFVIGPFQMECDFECSLSGEGSEDEADAKRALLDPAERKAWEFWQSEGPELVEFLDAVKSADKVAHQPDNPSPKDFRLDKVEILRVYRLDLEE